MSVLLPRYRFMRDEDCHDYIVLVGEEDNFRAWLDSVYLDKEYDGQPFDDARCDSPRQYEWCYPQDVERLELALSNVRALVARDGKKLPPEITRTLLRFCAEGGAKASPLREQASEPCPGGCDDGVIHAPRPSTSRLYRCQTCPCCNGPDEPIEICDDCVDAAGREQPERCLVILPALQQARQQGDDEATQRAVEIAEALLHAEPGDSDDLDSLDCLARYSNGTVRRIVAGIRAAAAPRRAKEGSRTPEEQRG